MAEIMTIGDFSRITHLSSKTLRYYHREGLVVPMAVNPVNGYPEYHVDQVPVANLVRRLRDLDVPVATVRELLSVAEPGERRRMLAEHLAAMEAALAETQRAVDSLRDLVTDEVAPEVEIAHRTDPPQPALVIAETIERRDLSSWYGGALDELAEVAASTTAHVVGPAGGLWSTALFLEERGEAALYLPIRAALAGFEHGRVRAAVLPSAELAVAEHRGPDVTISETYASLGRYVVRHELGVDGPVRERYLRTGDEDAVTEIGWPVFHVQPRPTGERQPVSSAHGGEVRPGPHGCEPSGEEHRGDAARRHDGGEDDDLEPPGLEG
jgi:DNA-binding transcriptional MerR regulator